MPLLNDFVLSLIINLILETDTCVYNIRMEAELVFLQLETRPFW